MKVTNVLFVGVGGQGIILASKIVAHCAFTEGLMVKESELHGMAQRGGSVVSHVRFGDEVYSPLIPKGKADILVAMEELEGVRSAHYLKPGGRVILNQRRIEPATVNPASSPYPEDVRSRLEAMGLRVDALNALEMAKSIGNLKVENIILIGALSRYLPFPPSLWERVIRDSVPPKTVGLNMTAFEKGRESVGGKE